MRKEYRSILILKEKYNTNFFYCINNLFFSMVKHGKKAKIFKIYSNFFFLLKSRYKKFLPHLIFFKIIVINLYSKIFLKTQHIGPVPYILPLISYRKSIYLIRLWLFESLKIRRERTHYLRFFSELIDVKQKKGLTYFKKFNYYKLALKSRSNLRFIKFMHLTNKNITYIKKY